MNPLLFYSFYLDSYPTWSYSRIRLSIDSHLVFYWHLNIVCYYAAAEEEGY
jgi:hypothetical protein